MSSIFSDPSDDSRPLTPEELGTLLGQGLDDMDPTQKSVAELFDVSEDALSNWRKGRGLKAAQISLFLWVARRNSRLRSWVASRIGIEVPEAIEDPQIAPIVEALELARKRRDWPTIREHFVWQLGLLGLYQPTMIDEVPQAAEPREKYGGT